MGKTKNIMSKIICFAMCMALVLAYVPYDAKAEESVVVLDVSEGSVVITEEGYHRGNGTIIPYTGDYIITGTTENSSNYIQLQSKAESSTITLQDLLINTGATSPISVWSSMEIYATGRLSLISSGFCINFPNNVLDFSIKGDADIIFESGANYSLHASNKDIDIECSSMTFDGVYLPSSSLNISAITDIVSERDISMGIGGESSITLSAGRNVQIMEDRYPVISCTNLVVNAGGIFDIEAHESITGPVIEGNVELNVGGDVSITTEYGTGIGGNLSGTVGGDFVLTGYMSPLCKDMDITAKSVYMEITNPSSGDCMVNAGGNNDVNITATDGDIVMELASPNAGAIYASEANLVSSNGDVILTNDANMFILACDANIDAQNIIFTNLRSEAPVITGDANLNAKESITISTESWVGVSGGKKIVGFGDTYTETNANATYVIKKGNTTDYTYNGSAQYADITVTKDGAPLTSGSDFSLTYTKDNVAVTAPTDAGTYVASVKDSSGASIVDVEYDILPYDITSSKLTLDATELTYDGKAKTINVTKIDDFTFNTTDFEVIGNTNTEVGEYTLEASPKSSNFTGTATAKYSIVEVKKEDVAYTILSGANSIWTTEGGDEIVVRADGDFSKFVSLQVDGKTLDADDYTAVSGSTVVTLKASFLKTLPEGKHTITFVYTDGTVSTQFEVKAVDVDGSPATGDAFPMVVMFALMTICTFGLVSLTRKQIKVK